MKVQQSPKSEPEVGQEDNYGRASSVIHRGYRMGQLQGEVSQEDQPPRGIQQHWETQGQEFLNKMWPHHTERGDPETLEEVVPWEDAKAFLASFEQVAKACRWPKEEWVARLLPALSGEAEQAFQSLEALDRKDYRKVKVAILRADALKTEAQRQHFRQFCCQEVEDPRRVYSHVQELCSRWLKPERRSKEQILELLVLEQFLASLPQNMQGWLRGAGPETCSQAVALVEDFMMSRQEDETRKQQESMNIRETWPIFSQPLIHPHQQIVLWKVLQDDPRVADSLGGESGSQIKMENSPLGGNEPEDIPKTLQQTSQGDVLGRLGMHNEGCEFKEEQWEQPMGTENTWKECSGHLNLKPALEYLVKEHTRDKMPVFSNCGRRLDMAHTLEDCKEEPCQENPYSSEHQITSGNKSEFFEEQEGDHLDTDQNNYAAETSDSSPERGKNVGFASSLKTNPGIQSEGRRYGCPQCGKCFLQRRNLMIHQRSHIGVLPCKCFQCGKCFGQRRSLTIHQRTHTGGKPHKCFQCGKSFSLGKYLKRHEGIHSGVKVKPYKCSQCEKCFNQEKELKIHQRIHTGEKPYQCSQCGKRFNQQGNLMNHWRIHTGEKPHKCSVCGKSFGRSNQLKTHQGIHTREKPYKCSQCGKCFRVGKYLKRHERIHAGQMKTLDVS
nr:zinc finger protein 397-like [Anolis sagrei ordinatus]